MVMAGLTDLFGFGGKVWGLDIFFWGGEVENPLQCKGLKLLLGGKILANCVG